MYAASILLIGQILKNAFYHLFWLLILYVLLSHYLTCLSDRSTFWKIYLTASNFYRLAEASSRLRVNHDSKMHHGQNMGKQKTQIRPKNVKWTKQWGKIWLWRKYGEIYKCCGNDRADYFMKQITNFLLAVYFIAQFAWDMFRPIT